jgi:chromosomal replication initiation ATPase DnaA
MRQLEIRITFQIPEQSFVLLLLRSIRYFFWAGIIQRAGGKIEHNFSEVSEITLEKIHRAVSKKTGIPEHLMLENTRKRQVVQARQIGMLLSKELIKPEPCDRIIGEYWAGRDHATVIHAYKTVANLAETDKKFAAQLQDIRTSLT